MNRQRGLYPYEKRLNPREHVFFIDRAYSVKCRAHLRGLAKVGFITHADSVALFDDLSIQVGNKK